MSIILGVLWHRVCKHELLLRWKLVSRPSLRSFRRPDIFVFFFTFIAGCRSESIAVLGYYPQWKGWDKWQGKLWSYFEHSKLPQGMSAWRACLNVFLFKGFFLVFSLGKNLVFELLHLKGWKLRSEAILQRNEVSSEITKYYFYQTLSFI